MKKSINIEQIIKDSGRLFSSVGIASARLDAEVLLAYVLNKPKSWLIAHGDEVIEEKRISQMKALVERRLQREPIAYIIGAKEFYGRDFSVTLDVLTPRPETEDLIDLCLKYSKKTVNMQNLYLEKGEPFSDRKKTSYRIIDVGTGSGCVGITLKLEMPEATVVLTDISTAALAVARKNAKKLDADVIINEGNLLDEYNEAQDSKSKIYFDFIVANLPYVDKSWEVSPETVFEPQLALFAEDGGLVLIKKLISQSQYLLKPGGFLALEADPEQHHSISEYAQENGFRQIDSKGYAIAFELD